MIHSPRRITSQTERNQRQAYRVGDVSVRMVASPGHLHDDVSEDGVTFRVRAEVVYEDDLTGVQVDDEKLRGGGVGRGVHGVVHQPESVAGVYFHGADVS